MWSTVQSFIEDAVRTVIIYVKFQIQAPCETRGRDAATGDDGKGLRSRITHKKKSKNHQQSSEYRTQPNRTEFKEEKREK